MLEFLTGLWPAKPKSSVAGDQRAFYSSTLGALTEARASLSGRKGPTYTTSSDPPNLPRVVSTSSQRFDVPAATSTNILKPQRKQAAAVCSRSD